MKLQFNYSMKEAFHGQAATAPGESDSCSLGNSQQVSVLSKCGRPFEKSSGLHKGGSIFPAKMGAEGKI